MDFVGKCNGKVIKNECPVAKLASYVSFTLPSKTNGFIHTGFHPNYPHQLVVLDLDLIASKKNSGYHLPLQENLPKDTMIVLTGSGGLHYYFWVIGKIPIPSTARQVKIAGHPEIKGCDVRSHPNGKVFIPNSKFTEHKEAYTIIQGDPDHIKVITHDEWLGYILPYNPPKPSPVLSRKSRKAPKPPTSIPIIATTPTSVDPLLELQVITSVREAFSDILKGVLDPKDHDDTFKVWGAFWREILYMVTNYGDYKLTDAANILVKNCSTFDPIQLSHNLAKIKSPDKRPTIELYEELFPEYAKLDYSDDEKWWNNRTLSNGAYMTRWSQFLRDENDIVLPYAQMRRVITTTKADGKEKQHYFPNVTLYIVLKMEEKRASLHQMSPYLWDIKDNDWLAWNEKSWTRIAVETLESKINNIWERCFPTSAGVVKDIKEIVSLYKRRNSVGSRHKSHFVLDDVNLIPLNNGMLKIANDYNSWQLLEFDPRYPVTYHIDVNYDQLATSPLTIAFLNQLLDRHNEHTQFYVESMLCDMAYSLIPYNKFQYAVFLLGEGGNGKGVMIGIMNAFFKGLHCGLTLRNFESNFGLENTVDKMFCSISETRAGKWNGGVDYKLWTGNDELSIDRKNKTAINHKPYSKLWLSVNTMFYYDSSSVAFMDRAKTHRCDNKFRGTEAMNENLIEDLTSDTEKSGLLNLMLPFLSRIKEFRNKHTEMSDPLKDFLKFSVNPYHDFLAESMVERRTDLTSHIITNEMFLLYRKYAFWKTNETITKNKSEQTKFGIKLGQYMDKHLKHVVKSPIKKRSGYKGVVVNPEMVELLRFVKITGDVVVKRVRPSRSE